MHESRYPYEASGNYVGACPREKRRAGNIKSYSQVKPTVKNPSHGQENAALISALKKGPIIAGMYGSGGFS